MVIKEEAGAIMVGWVIIDYHIKAESELFREFNVIPLLNYLSKREYAKPIPMQCNPIQSI